MAYPAVLEATVTGLQHPKWEERPIAIVVLREDYKEKVTKEDITEYLAKKFAKCNCLRLLCLLMKSPKPVLVNLIRSRLEKSIRILIFSNLKLP